MENYSYAITVHLLVYLDSELGSDVLPSVL